MNYTYTVKIIDRSNGESIKNIEAIGHSKARKIAGGVEINLNHEKYFVTVTKND